MIVYNRKDALQWRFIRRITRAQLAPPVHYLPTVIGFVEASARGLGWCLAAEGLIESALQKGEIMNIAPTHWLDVPLYWQHAAIRSSTLQQITRAMQNASARILHR